MGTKNQVRSHEMCVASSSVSFGTRDTSQDPNRCILKSAPGQPSEKRADTEAAKPAIFFFFADTGQVTTRRVRERMPIDSGDYVGTCHGAGRHPTQ